nr:unnamed protein product [Digitaria exilis]
MLPPPAPLRQQHCLRSPPVLQGRSSVGNLRRTALTPVASAARSSAGDSGGVDERARQFQWARSKTTKPWGHGDQRDVGACW